MKNLSATFLPLLAGFIFGIVCMMTASHLGVTSGKSKTFESSLKEFPPEQRINRTRVLCWIMTSPNNLYKRAINVRDTWTKRCDMRLFMSSEENKDFPTIGLPVKEAQGLYEKTKAAYKYLWQHHRDDADWFMKADDDAFVIPENLRYFLQGEDPMSPIYFGHKFKNLVNQGYMSGGAGYVLSKEAVRRYIDGLESQKCARGGGIEDVDIGRCMEKMGVIAGDSRDEEGKASMHPINIQNYVIKEKYAHARGSTVNDFYPACGGLDCTTKYPISFHSVLPEQMHVYNYLVYKAEVRGKTIFADP